LRGLVQGERRSIPERHGCVQLDGIVSLGRQAVGLIHLDPGLGECLLGVAALAFDLLVRLRREALVTFGLCSRYVTFTASAAAVACASVSATASATYCP